MFSTLLSKIDREIATIVGLGLCSMLIIPVENTMQNMQKTVVSSIEDDQPGFTVEGYTLTGIRFTLSFFVLWFSPYLAYALGPRIVMSISAIGYLFHMVSFITEDSAVVYAGALIVGLSEAVFWPAQGRYIIESSTPENLNRNVGIFLVFIKSSYSLANLFVFISFYGMRYVDRASRNMAIYSLSALTAIGVFSYGALPRTSGRQKQEYGAIKTLRNSWSMLMTPRMLCLCLSFCYNGLQLTFWSGIYSPSLGFTLAFGNSVKELVGLSGIFMSFGGVLGCLLPIIFSGWAKRHHYSRCLFVLAGSLGQIICYLISVLIMPDNAVFGNTEDYGLIPPSSILAMLGSFLLVFGDACLFVQTYSILGEFYRENSAEAIALHKCIRNLFVAASYYWSGQLGLYSQTAICAVMAVVNVASFFIVDRKAETSKSYEISALK